MSAKFPRGAVVSGIGALELAYSYLRDKPIIANELLNAISLLNRALELEEAAIGEDSEATKGTGI